MEGSFVKGDLVFEGIFGSQAIQGFRGRRTDKSSCIHDFQNSSRTEI